ncbi:MAG TPA: hypothetical protein VG479_12255 [Gaiellaceae bacterium]|jgi:hypothetical protein|nr:hypothetical protein [Gaiellaceae bacterium]
MDEARRVIRRLERIEALQGAHAPSSTLLAEVRQLLREGEAWLAAERRGAVRTPEALPGCDPTRGASAALDGCRRSLAAGEEVVPERQPSAAL